jgi:hypothetical protein
MSPMRLSIWHGTAEQAADLLSAVERHCACRIDPCGVRRTCCGAHRLLFEDQRALNGLVFARTQVDRWRHEEWQGAESGLRYYFTPSGRSAGSLREFFAACRAEPSVAETHLQRGYFSPWLHGIGRADLAQLAVQLQNGALDRFLQAAEPRA